MDMETSKVKFNFWRKEGGKLRYTVAVPAGYSVRVDNRSQLELVEEKR